MSKPQSLRCWDITQCQSSNCPVRQHEDRHCWEVVRERMNYQSALMVCEDCFVYIALYDKTNSSLTEEEISHIWEKKGLCNMASSDCSLSSPGGLEAV